MTPQKFRKKPVEIEAVRLTLSNPFAVALWCGGRRYGNSIYIDTLEGTMIATPGDWVIKEPFPTADRLFYPCKPDIFEQTYEAVS